MPAHEPPALSHLEAADYARFGYVDEKTIHTYFKFSFVPKPWAVAISSLSDTNSGND